MKRCAELLLIATLCSGLLAAQQIKSEILVHTGLTAGLAHHDAREVWDQMQVGDSVALVRESSNPHDTNAVRIEWRGHLLGYLPRSDNQPVARQLDRGSRLTGRIARLDRYRNHRLRLEIDVLLGL
jgi:hypothetical protein